MNERKVNSIISAYKKLKQKHQDTWIKDCSSCETIEKAIELAATGRNNAQKKHNHQYRIPNVLLKEFSEVILEKINEIKKVKSFDDLINIIDVCKLRGISHLTIYDTALRIGCFLDIYPDRVYLHAGTRKGAEIFLGKIKEKYIFPYQLPEPFRTNDLSATEIEDILCIYKDRLATCI